MTSADVRERLMRALALDLVGPEEGSPLEGEVLSQAPSRWYLTGFLVPRGAAEEQRTEETSREELDEQRPGGGSDDAGPPDRAAARRAYYPSSMGLSLLVSKETKRLTIAIHWGDYSPLQPEGAVEGERVAPPSSWKRTQRESTLELDVPAKTARPLEREVPESDGLRLALAVRPVLNPESKEGGVPAGTRSVSVFLVNERRPRPDEVRDEAFVFQAELLVTSETPFVPRPNLRGLESDDWDDRVADLQYRDAFEYAVGHGVSTEATRNTAGECRSVRTKWIPNAQVERVAPSPIQGVELGMEALAAIQTPDQARERLRPLVAQYRAWIDSLKTTLPNLPKRRMDTAKELLHRARTVADRIAAGIDLLQEPQAFDAFRIANRSMARAARRRFGTLQARNAADVDPPAWRPFQLAFILMNLPAIADPLHADREVVDLLFFPTGGGKTEAYLGLAAFTLVLRRLRNPGLSSAGLSVLMRYTLRLLTLDQLSRAAGLICALELERQKDAGKLGDWPFEIGLWVGLAATPNKMGRKGDNDSYSARAKTIAYKNNDRKASPIPLENCPWCGTRFKPSSFDLLPNPENPTDLRINCINRDCEFTRGRYLPILAVDEPIYRRLPCFLIATVDKFAAMPWTGQVGAFFGHVDRADKHGFYGPCDPNQGEPLPGPLQPPDLVIQDELHLISGPLGTMVGLYESALDTLCERERNGKRVRPKVIASTATVRRAEKQILALFNRRVVDIFPAPGPDRRDSFFARVESPAESPARVYLGVAAQGRSLKVVLLRTYLTLLGAAQKAYVGAGGSRNKSNPADPYMTLLGYFNSLRELGGSRRIVEDEVSSRLNKYGERRREGEADGLFADRKIAYDVVELTSRVPTDKVAEAKRRLALPFHENERVDVAIATNMISVGLDIPRLGLMVVLGQPKTSAEYIQATSRVGRDAERPGLVVTLLNIHRPRDRSHYERFAAYHESFYRSVEATSVTPFSPRALDRGLAGAVVALARLGHAPMTPPRGATEILRELGRLDFVSERLAQRAKTHAEQPEEEGEALRLRVRDRARDLLDEWSQIAHDYGNAGVQLQYQEETGAARRLLYEYLHPELKNLPPRQRKFRANRSLRDVEPQINLWLKTLDNADVEFDEDEE